MPSIYWYYVLIVIGVVICAYTVYKKRNIADLLSYFLFATGCSWELEGIVLFLFNAYIYKPGISSDPFIENIIGHIIANTAFWGSTAIFVMTFQLSNVWIAVIAVAYMLIEELFLKLGAYSHYWWKTYFTGIGAFFFMYAMKKWYSAINKKGYKSLRIITLWIIAWVLIQTPSSTLMLMGKQYFNVNWFSNIYRSSTLYSCFFYNALMASIFILFVCIFKKWYWKITPFFIFMLGDIILIKMNILIIHNGWDLFYTLLLHAISLVSFILFNKYTLKVPKNI